MEKLKPDRSNFLTGGLGYRPAGKEVPYCGNRYERLLYTPDPEPSYSEDPATPNGAFDVVSAIAETAQYEVLFATMQWEKNDSPPSPGSVLAQGVAELYRKVKANPDNYPRGMTVRILLGNYTEFSNFDWGTQINYAISDMRDAGVEKMVDPQIGWRLEMANFPGTYPHSHTKFIVVDGKTVVGFQAVRNQRATLEMIHGPELSCWRGNQILNLTLLLDIIITPLSLPTM